MHILQHSIHNISQHETPRGSETRREQGINLFLRHVRVQNVRKSQSCPTRQKARSEEARVLLLWKEIRRVYRIGDTLRLQAYFGKVRIF